MTSRSQNTETGGPSLLRSSSNFGGRKRPLQDQEEIALPLRDVMVCLSGFTHEQKDTLHQLIESLGGTYTRELNLDKNTHLITEVSHGAKYELAAANPGSIKIVSSAWLHTAAETKKRPSETKYSLSFHKQVSKPTSSSKLEPLRQQSRPTIAPKLDNALNQSYNNQVQRQTIFRPHYFYLLGFKDSSDDALKQKISKLIRRGNGTIYWELNEDITMLVLCDGCDSSLFKAAQVVSQHHANLPPVVSPLWIVESYQQNQLQSAQLYPPIQSIVPTSASTIKKGNGFNMPSTAATNSIVFKGCLFSLLKTKIDDHESSKVLDFDAQEQAAFVNAHGGQLLSSKLVEALKADASKKQTATSQRKCYVICWGGGNPRVDTSPLVSQVQRDNLCQVVLVTPLWVQTCVTVHKRVRPELVPLILMPQAWSMKGVLSKADRKKKADHQRRLDISLTGFQGTEKAAITHVIGAIGGLYHDHMSNTNTHLICKEDATGIKLEKALEWGLHVVKVEWLYHVLEHGYGGEENKAHGCEDRFTMKYN